MYNLNIFNKKIKLNIKRNKFARSVSVYRAITTCAAYRSFFSLFSISFSFFSVFSPLNHSTFTFMSFACSINFVSQSFPILTHRCCNEIGIEETSPPNSIPSLFTLLHVSTVGSKSDILAALDVICCSNALTNCCGSKPISFNPPNF